VATGDSQFYGKTAQGLMNGGITIDFDTDTIKVGLVTSSYTPDVDADDFWDDVSANEISDATYTAGGETLSVTVSYDAANNRAEADATDPSWTFTGTPSPAYAILWKDTTTASTSPLIGYWELSGNPVSGLTLQFDAEGFAQFVADTVTA